MEYGIQSSGNPSCPELSSGCPRSRSRTPWGPCKTSVGGRRAGEQQSPIPAFLQGWEWEPGFLIHFWEARLFPTSGALFMRRGWRLLMRNTLIEVSQLLSTGDPYQSLTLSMCSSSSASSHYHNELSAPIWESGSSVPAHPPQPIPPWNSLSTGLNPGEERVVRHHSFQSC